MPDRIRTYADLAALLDSHEQSQDLRDFAISVPVIGETGLVSGKMLATSIVRQSVADGVDENAANVTIAGMAVGDELVGVIVFTTKAAIASLVLRPAGDFVPGAGIMVSTANKVNNTNNQYLVTWIDHTP